jgi:hypothetical protein
MTLIVRALLAFAVSLVRSRLSLQMEMLALQQQVAVYRRSIRRPQVRPCDRLLWSWLSRGWARWREARVFVQPATVLAWQRTRFRTHWARLRRTGSSGSPTISQEVRELTRGISAANPRWGPRASWATGASWGLRWRNPRAKRIASAIDHHILRPGGPSGTPT